MTKPGAYIQLLLLPIIAGVYFHISSQTLWMKIATFCVAVFVSYFVPADGDITLLFFARYGKSLSDLKEKVVWITGASSGLGAALAVELAHYGIRVVISARNVEKLELVKKQCIEMGGEENNIMVLPLDIVKYNTHETALNDVIKKFGKVDILVSNAGRSQRAPWDTIETSVDKEIFELNVFSLVALARLVTKHFLENSGGHHVVTSSTAGKVGPPFSGSYSASKHALHGYFETLRFEKNSDGIDVTMLCPGPFESSLMDACFSDKLDKKVEAQRTGSRMSAERCAELTGVAIANKLSEVWIAEHPVLLFYYVAQYCPTLYRVLAAKLGKRWVMKLRDGNNDAVKAN